jgi:hypothetical protein
MSPVGCLVFFRMATRSTASRHSPFADPTERNKLPTISNPTTQGPENGFCPSSGRMRFGMRWRFVCAHAYIHLPFN